VNTSSGGSNLEVMLCKLSFVKDVEILLDPNVFIADSGAFTHSTGSGIGMVDLQEREMNAGIMMPNGNIMKPSKTGKLPVAVCNKHAGELFNAVVEDVNNVPEQQLNLFTTTKLIKAGQIPGGNTEVLWFTKGNTVIKLDIEIPTKNGCIFGIYLKREVEVSAMQMKTTVMQAHEKLGHCSEDLKIGKSLRWDITKGSFNVCEACTITKARQKNVPKESEHVLAGKPNAYLWVCQ
jgi:hypothetical protein